MNPSKVFVLKSILEPKSIGGGLKFDGVNDTVNFGIPTALANAHLENLNNPRSISLIFSLNNVYSRQEIINFDSKFNNTNRLIDFGLYNNTQLLFLQKEYYGGQQVRFNTQPFIQNQVYHFIFTYTGGDNASNIKGYLDNTQLTYNIDSNTPGNLYYSPDLKLRLSGYYSNSYNMNGNIWDFKIFTKALSLTEINDLYTNKGSIIPTTAQNDLLLNVKLEEGQGINASDDSGNNINGSLINYSIGTTDHGTNNSWIDDNGNPILI